MTFGDQLRSQRLHHGFSQQELAEKLFVTSQTISKWENDLSEPGFEMVKALTQLFNISYDDLFSDQDLIIDTQMKYSAVKDQRMKNVYLFFTMFLAWLSVALFFTSVYISTLTLPFGFALGLFGATIYFFLVFMLVLHWREDLMCNLEETIDVYPGRIELSRSQQRINETSIRRIVLQKARFYSGIRVYEDNGHVMIELNDQKKISVRDIYQIEDLQHVIRKWIHIEKENE